MTQDPKAVAARSISSSAYNIGSSTITLGLGFLRQVLLARALLPAEVGDFNNLSLVFLSLLGLLTHLASNQALIHRQEDVQKAATTHFVLNLGLAGLRIILAFLAAPLLRQYYAAHIVQALLALAGLDLFRALNATPSVLMSKELDFRRLALLDVLTSLGMTITAPTMAYLGFGFWSLVGEQAAGVLVRTVMLWGVYRPWKARWSIDWPLARWYLRFGWSMLLSGGLGFLLNQFDDWWAATALGSSAGGFYSEAYGYAGYPRRLVAGPVMDVFFPTYAKVQHDRISLSKTFFRVNSLVLRVGFLFAGMMALVAPEFIRIFPSAKWLPMVPTFRLMLIYTLFDPMIASAGSLAVALGQPQILTRIKAIQAAVFVPLVLLLARYYVPAASAMASFLGLSGYTPLGIEGIAIAADVMLLLGVVLTFRAMRRYVDFSPRRLFGWPLLGVSLGLAAGYVLEWAWALPNDWIALIAKAGLFGGTYLGLLLLVERREYQRNIEIILNLIRRPRHDE